MLSCSHIMFVCVCMCECIYIFIYIFIASYITTSAFIHVCCDLNSWSWKILLDGIYNSWHLCHCTFACKWTQTLVQATHKWTWKVIMEQELFEVCPLRIKKIHVNPEWYYSDVVIPSSPQTSFLEMQGIST